MLIFGGVAGVITLYFTTGCGWSSFHDSLEANLLPQHLPKEVGPATSTSTHWWQWFPWFHKIHTGKPTWQWKNDKIIWRGISYRRWGWLGVWHTCLLHTTCMFTYNFILLLFLFMFCICFGSTFNVLCWNLTYGPFLDCLFGVHETCCERIWSWTYLGINWIQSGSHGSLQLDDFSCPYVLALLSPAVVKKQFMALAI